MTEDVSISKILETIKDFPPMPQTAFKVIQILKDEDFHFTDLMLCISKDINLTAEILRMANSSLYSPPNTIKTLQHAISYLGTEAVKNLVISLSSKTLYSSGNVRLLDQKLWEHSLATAICARITAIRKCKKYSEESFILGLMHDIGQLILGRQTEAFEKIVMEAFNRDIDVLHLEFERLGFDHTSVGGLAMKKWDMPDLFYEVVKYHHTPEKSENKQLAYVICFANNLVKKNGFGITNYFNEEDLAKAAEFLGIDEEEQDEITEQLMEIFQKEKSLFAI